MNEVLKKILSFICFAVIGFALGCGTYWYASRRANQATSENLRAYERRVTEMQNRLGAIQERCDLIDGELATAQYSISGVIESLYKISDAVAEIEDLAYDRRLYNSRICRGPRNVLLIEQLEVIGTKTGTYYAKEE
jgi:hypothetical protein